MLQWMLFKRVMMDYVFNGIILKSFLPLNLSQLCQHSQFEHLILTMLKLL